jgi:DNA-binding CsgD family transcriptional regulator
VLERGLAINRAIGYPGGISPIVDHLGDIARERGDNDQALTYYRESLAAWLHLRDPHGAADSLAGFAVALLGLGDPEGATRLLSAAGAVYEGLGFSRSRYGPAYKDDVITALRDQLGDERLDELWIGGQELTLESALQEAIAYSPRIGRAPHVTIPPKASSRMERFGLTQREAETLELLIEGKSNAEIGARLSISPRTAGTHIANIYGKIGVSSRAALVAAVLRGDTQA